MQSFTDQVRGWAATKPADEPYDYASNDNCALCQFLKAAGYSDDPRVGGDYWRDSSAMPFGGRQGLHNFGDKLKVALVSQPWTFGALAERLA